MLVRHDEVVVGVRFRRSTGGPGDGALHGAARLVEVPGLGRQVVHAPSVRGTCILAGGHGVLGNASRVTV